MTPTDQFIELNSACCSRFGQQPGMGAGAPVVVQRAVGRIAVREQAEGTRREAVVGLVVVVQRQTDLLHVVDALTAARRLPRRLHRRQEQGDQDRDDRNDDQQLDQRETAPASSRAQTAKSKESIDIATSKLLEAIAGPEVGPG